MEILVPRTRRAELGDSLDEAALELADIKMMEAWQILKDETCPSCGNPIWVAYNTDNNVGFRVDSTVCYSCKEIEHERTNSKEDKEGRTFFAVPYTYVEGSQLPTRQSYMERLANAR